MDIMCVVQLPSAEMKRRVVWWNIIDVSREPAASDFQGAVVMIHITQTAQEANLSLLVRSKSADCMYP